MSVLAPGQTDQRDPGEPQQCGNAIFGPFFGRVRSDCRSLEHFSEINSGLNGAEEMYQVAQGGTAGVVAELTPLEELFRFVGSKQFSSEKPVPFSLLEIRPCGNSRPASQKARTVSLNLLQFSDFSFRQPGPRGPG